jgi:lysophospholipase L1-like esterase
MALLVAASIALAACDAGDPAPSTPEEEATLRYVALGDSYTIGTSVPDAERWPNQLVARTPGLELAGNLGVDGYTSADLIREELPALDAFQPEFVSVLIGVNDVVQGVPEPEYAGNVALILGDLLARLPSSRIVCVATPDYTVTPSGATYGDPGQQSAAIARANAILREACEARDIAFVPEIFEISQAARVDPSLVADDGLHPSGAQYSRWVEAIEPIVKGLLAS